jgi:NAD(P)-dependent dehydrogenase (short-subunit alcohol dehydrogenase family)
MNMFVRGSCEGNAMTRLLIGLLLSLTLVPIAGCTSTPEAPAKAVLVTGASTGIGRKITERLAHDGFFVYAGARKAEDIKELSAIPNVQGISLDVTKPDEVEAAVETITNAKRGLYGLVNNAGVITIAPVVDTPWNEFDLVMAVNVYGPYRLTKAFAPLIKAAHGRIINIGSVAGVLAGANASAYAMSKHAMEAFTDSLAQEMIKFGVRVSVIEPGTYASEIWKSALKRKGDSQAAAAAPKLPEPDDVAAAAENALSDQNPKRRYLVVPNRQEADATIRKQIEQLVQLNEDQPYAYDRDALIKMLDEALAKSHKPGK